MACIIWGTDAKEIATRGDYVDLDSPRAGGRYRGPGQHNTVSRS
jgi:hypothetical protein